MALFDNDGSPTDVINFYADLFGDGAIMDSFRAKFAAEREGKLTLEQKEVNACIKGVQECPARRVENATGLAPDFRVTQRQYHGYAAAFKMKAAEQGMTLEGNGYECWQDDDFKNWFKKRHPGQVFREEARNARIIVNDLAKFAA